MVKHLLLPQMTASLYLGQRGRASLRKRTTVAHAMAHQLVHQGRRAHYKGLPKNQSDGRRPAAVSNLQVAAHYAEERRLAP